MSGEAYYVDSVNGDDANAGTSDSAPWKTAAKVNAMGAATPHLFRTELNVRYGSTINNLLLTRQGHPQRYLRIKPYGPPAAGRPKILGGAASPLGGGVFLDSCFGVSVEGIEIDVENAALVSGLVQVFFTAPERAWPLRVRDLVVRNAGYDLVLIVYPLSALAVVLGQSAGSNVQGAHFDIEGLVGDNARNDGVSWNGAVASGRIVDYALSNIGAGTASPVDSNSGDALTGHDASGHVYVGRGTVDTCVDYVHSIARGPATIVVDGLRGKGASRSCVTLEHWAELESGTHHRFEAHVLNSILCLPAGATGPAAVALGRSEVAGSIGSLRLWNSLIHNAAAKPSVLATWLADARSDECFLDVRNVGFNRVGASAKHVQLTRNGRTPRVVAAANRYLDDASGLWRIDSTDYDFAGWKAAGDGLVLTLDSDADRPSSVGALGLVGDPSSDFGYARTTDASALRRGGATLAPSVVYFTFATRDDAAGRQRPAADGWDIGPFQASGGDPMDLTTLARVKAQLGKTDTADDAALTEIITNVSRRMERYMGRDAYLVERTEYLNLRAGQTSLRLRGLPVSAVASVYYDPTSVFGDDTLLTATTDYVVDAESERLTLRTKPVFDATRALKVTYTGGMAADVPGLVSNGYGDLVQAATNQVISEWKRHALGGVNVESASGPGGSVSYTRDGWLRSVEDVLDRYRVMDL